MARSMHYPLPSREARLELGGIFRAFTRYFVVESGFTQVWSGAGPTLVVDVCAQEGQNMDSMDNESPLEQSSPGLPAAATVEASILLAQRLIAADMDRKRAQALTPPDESAQAKLAA